MTEYRRERSKFLQSLNDEIHWATPVNQPKIKRKTPPMNCTCRPGFADDDMDCPYHSGDDEGKDYD